MRPHAQQVMQTKTCDVIAYQVALCTSLLPVEGMYPLCLTRLFRLDVVLKNLQCTPGVSVGAEVVINTRPDWT